MFQNVQIRSKLIAILVGPLLALTILSSVGIGTNLAQSAEADRVNRLSLFAGKLSSLVNELQQERSLSNVYLGAGRLDGRDQLLAQRPSTDRLVADYRAAAADLKLATAGGSKRGVAELQRLIDYGLHELGKLPLQRRLVDNGRMPTTLAAEPAEPTETEVLQNTGLPGDHGPINTVDKALDQYTDTVGDLLNVNDELVYQGAGNDRELLRGLVTFADLARAKEFADVERGLIARVLAGSGHLGSGDHAELSAVIGGEQLWISRFAANATADQRAEYTSTVTGPDVTRAEQLRKSALTSDEAPHMNVGSQDWWRATSRKLDLMRRVEVGLTGDVSAVSAALKHSADRRALLYSIALTIVLWLAVGLSLVTSRSMVGPLRRLKDAAEKVARRTLPGVVERLQAGERVDLDAEAAAPIEVYAKDEIGQVAEAFNAVHRVAVRVAGEQAALRKSVGDMFLNLARRSQSLVDRQLELIDDLERGETDPEALENLFRLDHLATRMRRNAENLIVLSGSEPARRWSDPVPLIDVVRAAIAEVEDYTRVELLPIEPLALAGQAVSDVVHLLAELIENATSFSPPGTKVQVAGQHVSSGYVVEIEDRGLGMTDPELVEANERLANPPTIDFALSRMLGIFVVGRLATRYGVKVQLRHSWYGGVTALVLFPENLVVRPSGATAPMPPVDGVPTHAQIGSDGISSLGELPPPPVPPVDRSQLDSLPIFEAARSDWFEIAPDGSHLPLRRHATQLGPPVADEHTALPRGGEQPALDSRPTAWPEASRPPAPDEVEVEAEAESDVEEPAAAPAPGYGLGSAHVPEPPMTRAGLPRRIPRANLAPEMLSNGPPAGEQPPPSAGGRTPTEVRSMLASYRSGLERGRSAAATRPSRGGEEGPEEAGGTPDVVQERP
ncbi:MAG TPA: nitrate- and nitrite sensing domain-containing protein [Actinomycetes bacterium]